MARKALAPRMSTLPRCIPCPLTSIFADTVALISLAYRRVSQVAYPVLYLSAVYGSSSTISTSSQFVGIRRNQFAHQPVLDFGGLHGYHCRCQQQYYESEDPDGYVIVPFRVRAIIVIYKNKK